MFGGAARSLAETPRCPMPAPRLSAVLMLLFAAAPASAQWTRFVNVFTGTGGVGHTFPGATRPFGMVQLSPDTRVDDSWESCAGYYYADSLIYGFSHTHLSGTGIPDYGDVMLMPLYGDTTTDRARYRSRFRHDSEAAAPGFYSVTLDDEGIRVRLTATERVGLQEYTFPRAGLVNVVLDLRHRDRLLEGSARSVSPSAVEGLRRSSSWAQDQRVYYRTEFSKPWVERHTRRGPEGTQAVVFRFRVRAGERLFVKTALSSTGTEGAARNLQAEMPGWGFDAVRRAADVAWNRELGRIAVSGGTLRARQNFYTALYHVMIAPNLWSDVDGRYRGLDGNVHTAEGTGAYTVFSLWDTFRTLHPLLTLIDPERTRDMVRTMLAMHRQSGRLPVWELAANETNTMIGFHAVPVIADAYVKGITGFDPDEALRAMVDAANHSGYGQPTYNRNGFLAVEDEHESVSKTLEYAYDHGVIALMAQALGRDSLAAAYRRTALGYRNLFDAGAGFFRPRQNGGWLTPFDPREVNNHFTEANAWQYGFFAPHDVAGHLRLLGGPAPYAAKLDSLFRAPERTTGRNQADITGLIGQYAHGNEPSHHVAYLYTFAGQGARTQRLVRTVLDSLYAPTPDGLPGNEDCGQMSAWFVMSALGLYPVTPGHPHYAVGTPLFERAVVRLANGRQLTITGNPAAGPYVAGLRLHGRPYGLLSIPHDAIAGGGTLAFTLAGRPQPWGRAGDVPAMEAPGFVPAPVVEGALRSFKERQVVTLRSLAPGMTIRYSRDGAAPTATSPVASGPIEIAESGTLRAVAFDAAGHASGEARAVFTKRPNDWAITLGTPYSRQYTAGGPEGIIDGIRGETDWRKGGWQGYQGTTFTATLDFGRRRTVRRVWASFLQDTRPWIVLPRAVVFEASDDGQAWREVYRASHNVPPDDYTAQVYALGGTLPAPVEARFLRIRAEPFGTLPAWHLGAGHPAWTFVDEVGVE
jgi:predicted alpha-1,2-mannosidase